MNPKKFEIKTQLYAKMQAEFDHLRAHGVEKSLILEILSDRYFIRQSTIKANIDTESMDMQAREYAQTILRNEVTAPVPPKE